MDRSQKESVVGTLKEKFDRMTSAVFLDFKGLDVEAVTKLRDEFRKSGVEYRVVKNSLVHHAVSHHGWAGKLDPVLVGMTGVAWSFEDPSAAAKVVKAFRKDNEKLKIKAGLIEGQILARATRSSHNSPRCPARTSSARCSSRRSKRRSRSSSSSSHAGPQNFVYLLKAKEEQGGEGGAA